MILIAILIIYNQIMKEISTRLRVKQVLKLKFDIVFVNEFDFYVYSDKAKYE